MSAPDGVLEMRDFPGAGDPSHLLPRRTAQNAPFFAALAERRLRLQRCTACGHARYPVAPACPRCGCTAAGWDVLRGTGSVHSWIRYRKSYLPEFEPLMPYAVLCVAIDDGPRMFGRLAGTEADPAVGDRVRTIVERLPSGSHTIAFIVDEGGADGG
jgi:uncharacterized OB-fold protein